MSGPSTPQINTWIAEIDEAARRASVQPRVAAVNLVRELSPAQIRELAIRFLVEGVADRRRAQTLIIERVSQRAQAMSELVRAGASAKRLPRRGSKAYQEWVETTDEGRAYEERQRETDSALADMDRTFRQQLATLVDEFVEGQRCEWTTELLNAAIAMPDGTIVLWGDATLEQHLERREMFMQNALVNAEGAARHEQAIRELQQTGAATLREMVAA